MRKVYGELLQAVDTRSAIGLHVMQHVGDFVATQVEFVDGVPYYRWYGFVRQVRGLFVHPKTGLLREHRISRKPRPSPIPADEQELVRISASERFEKWKGLWFRLEFAVNDAGEMLVRKQQCDRKTIQKIERGEYGSLERKRQVTSRQS